MVPRSAILPLLLFVPTCVDAQSECTGLTFSGTKELSLATSQGTVLLVRQPNGSFYGADLDLSPTYKFGSLYSNYQNAVLNGCAADATLTATFPSVPDTPPALGVGSQPFAMADFQRIGIPSIVATSFSDVESKVNFISLTTFPNVTTTSYSTSSGVASLAAGDFNNDGKYDFVAVVVGNVAVGTPGGVQIFIGNGNGTFKTGASYVTGLDPLHVTVADLDGDGKLDLVVCGDGTSAITVLLGNGDGTFHAAAATPMAGKGPVTVIAADFNNDHKLDLGVSNEDGTVSILLGNGDGSFQTAMSFPCGSDCYFLAAADFNGDGKLDLAVANIDTYVVSVLIGKGGGTFGAPAYYAGGYTPASLVVTDFNNDGKLDLVVGTGTPDYLSEIRESGNIDVLLSNGDGTFQGTPLLTAGQFSRALAIADLNGDRKPDVVVANENSGDLTVFLGQGNGEFQTLAPYSLTSFGALGPVSVAAADFNGDGKMDVATVDETAQNVAISLGNGDGTFHAPNVLAAGVAPVFVAAGDLNGDGKPDLVVADNGSQDPLSPASGAVLVFLSTGSGFQPLKRLAAGQYPSSVVIQDVNLDGIPDLVVSDFGQDGVNDSGGASVLLGTGGGNFGPAVSYLSGTFEQSLAVADVNGDGKPDLILPALDSNFNDKVLIFPGKGDGTFLAPSVLTASQGNSNVIVGDFNGDGKPDLILANCCGLTSMSYFLGNGDGTFQPEALFNGGPAPIYVGAADFNNDGKPDLAIANNQNVGALAILLNTTPAPPSKMTANSNTTPQSAATGSAFANALAVTVTDSGGHPVAGISVTFTAPSAGASGTFQAGGTSFTATTNANGVATAATFTANATAGTYTVTATSAGLPTVGFSLTNTASPPANMTANANTTPQSAATGSAFANTLAVTVTDSGGHPVAGVSVAFTAPSGGASGTFQAGGTSFTTITNANGVATAATFTANATAGTYTVTATSAGLPTVGFSLTNTASPPANMTANANTTPQSAATGSAFANTLAVTVTDSGGHPVAGISVTFAAPSAGASGTFQGGGTSFNTITNANGVATAATFTANTSSGTYTVTATSAGLPAVGFALTNTTATTHPAFFAGEDSLGGGVYYLQFPNDNLFGYYNYPASSILYHYDMGFEALVPSTAGQIYFYDFASGHWWYTSSSLFPYLYDFTLNTFIYYFLDTKNPGHYTTNPRYFANLTTQMIFNL